MVEWALKAAVGFIFTLFSIALSVFVYHVDYVTKTVEKNTESNIEQIKTSQKMLVVLDNLDESVVNLLEYQKEHTKETHEGFNRIRCVERLHNECPDVPVER